MQKLNFIIIFCLFLSCTKEANIKLPEAKPMTAMYSYICPSDTIIRLKLMSSSPLYSSNEIDVLASVSDGDVKISGAQGTAQLIFNQNTGYYELKTSSYPIVPGQLYKMKVTAINGDVATAETQVPFTAVPINMVTVEAITENNQTSDLIKVSFTDEPGRVNYYRMAALNGFAYTFQADTIVHETRISELYSDINHDGENVSLAGRFRQRSDSTEYYAAEYYDVLLYNCSESYYNFNKSPRNGSGISFPPPGEPTLMYSNVKGGFGCFGAYLKTTVRYKKK
jgi:hypothetical protein